MYPDPSRFSEFDLKNEADFKLQQVRESRRKGLPTIVQIVLVPFLVLAWALKWTWHMIRPPKR
jgi:hypothetical protein